MAGRLRGSRYTNFLDTTAENRNLCAVNDGLQNALQERGFIPDVDLAISRWPLSPKEIAGVFLAAFPNRLYLTEAAFKSLDDCGTQADILWDAFYDLCTRAYDLYLDPDRKNIVQEFKAGSRFELILGAGSATRKSNALMSGYEDEYKGKKIICESHLRNGSKESDPKFVRLYFCFDRDDSIIVVSSVGEHKDTAATISGRVH